MGEAGRTGEPQLVDALRDILGLTDTETEAYLFLRHHEEATASQIARATHSSRGATYACLRELAATGLVQEVPTSPITFRPMPFDEVLLEAQRISERRIQALKNALTALPQPAEETATHPDVVRPGDVSVVATRRGALSELRRGIDSTQTMCWGLGARRATTRILRAAGLLESLRDAARRDVDVRLYLPEEDENLAHRRRLQDAVGTAAVRVPPAGWDGHVTIMVTDEAAFVYIPQPASGDAEGEDLLVRMAGTVFSQTFSQLFPPDEPTAPADRDTTWESVVEACRSAEEEVLWMRGATAQAPHPAENRIGRALPEGVAGRRLRARTVAGLDEERAWEDREVPAAPFWYVLVDGRRLFQATAALPGRSGSALRFSDDPEELTFYKETFERFWTRERSEEHGARGHAPQPSEARFTSAGTGPRT